MKKYFIVFAVFVLFFGCGRTGTSGDSVATLSKDSSGKKDFDIILKSQYIENKSGYVKQGHYSLLFKYSGDNKNLHGLLFENDNKYSSSESREAKVVLDPSTNSITNNILLLLDFSGSIINDYSRELTKSVISFIDGVERSKVKIAIYYLNSKEKITPIVAEPMDSKGLKTTVENLLNDAYFDNIIQENLISTNLYGATIQATEIACKWIGNCSNDIVASSEPTLNVDNFEFSSVVVFTDGRDQAGWAKESDMISAIKRNKALFYQGIGIGKNVDKELIEEISTDKGIYEKELNTESIDSAFEKLTIWANSFYEARYCPADQKGSVDIEIQVKNNQGIIGRIKEKGVKLINSEEFRCDIP